MQPIPNPVVLNRNVKGHPIVSSAQKHLSNASVIGTSAHNGNGFHVERSSKIDHSCRSGLSKFSWIYGARPLPNKPSVFILSFVEHGVR